MRHYIFISRCFTFCVLVHFFCIYLDIDRFRVNKVVVIDALAHESDAICPMRRWLEIAIVCLVEGDTRRGENSKRDKVVCGWDI